MERSHVPYASLKAGSPVPDRPLLLSRYRAHEFADLPESQHKSKRIVGRLVLSIISIPEDSRRWSPPGSVTRSENVSCVARATPSFGASPADVGEMAARFGCARVRASLFSRCPAHPDEVDCCCPFFVAVGGGRVTSRCRPKQGRP